MTPERRPARRRAAGPPSELDPKAARQAAFDLLARKAWSRRELTQRLKRRGASEATALAVVEDLGARGYLDDDGFARWWAQARAQSRRVGSMRLRQELRAKGIARDLVAAAVDAAFTSTPELERAIEAGRRRLAVLARTAPDRVPARLGSYLLRRGYPPAVASRVVRTLLADRGDGGPGEVDEGGV